MQPAGGDRQAEVMKIAILHYSVSPVVGGVESVIQAHTRLLLNAGYSVKLIAGAGEASAVPEGAEFNRIRQMDSLHPLVVELSQQLEAGSIPKGFEKLTTHLEQSLGPTLEYIDIVIIHNIFTKHFNLPLTVALERLLDKRKIKHPIAWCHDFTWTSSHSQPMVHPGYPWDSLRTFRDDVTYVTVSQKRQLELASLYRCPSENIRVIYNGVDPASVYGLSDQGMQMVDRLGLQEADLVLLMPVRITQAKNIEFALYVIAGLKSIGIMPKLVITGPPDPHDPADLQYYQSLLELRQLLHAENEVHFIYESGPNTDEGYIIGSREVMELYRVCDALFMPSHREGFGMSILEAGLLGKPIFTTPIPAAAEIGGSEVIRFSPDDPPEIVVNLILSWANGSPTYLLKQRVRQKFTWQAIFQHDILPLLQSKEAK
jgi:glycosyltransferase involved in cell wall biosynthesis